MRAVRHHAIRSRAPIQSVGVVPRNEETRVNGRRSTTSAPPKTWPRLAGPAAGLVMSRRLELEPGLDSFYDPITISTHTKK